MLASKTNTQDTIQSPFGMVMPGRNWTAGTAEGYGFGFNGKLKDNEIMGGDNILDLGARIYNPRIGKFLKIDPLESKYPFQSPYAYCSNSPIWLIDYNGEGNEKHREKDMDKFRKKQDKLARKLGEVDYDHATPDHQSAIRETMDDKFKNRRWMWSWTNSPDQDEFSKTNNNQLDQSTSRQYYKVSQLVDQADGVFARSAVTISTEVSYSTTTINRSTIEFTADLSGILINGGVTISATFDSPGRVFTATVFQDRVGGGTSSMGSPVAKSIAGPVTLSPATPTLGPFAMNLFDGNFITVRVTALTVVRAGMVMPRIIASATIEEQPKSYHITDNKGRYSFWRKSVKSELFKQAL